MEIINIEARTFEAMLTRFEQFVKRMDALCSQKDKGLQKWLDNQDICQILNISKRTLQTYRDNATLPLFPNQLQNVLQAGICSASNGTIK